MEVIGWSGPTFGHALTASAELADLVARLDGAMSSAQPPEPAQVLSDLRVIARKVEALRMVAAWDA